MYSHEKRRRWIRDYVNDVIAPTHVWPSAIRNLLMRKHITNPQRFKLVVFLLGNGMSPPQVRELLESYTLDKAAWRQIDWILKNAFRKNYTYWDMTENRSSHLRSGNIPLQYKK